MITRSKDRSIRVHRVHACIGVHLPQTLSVLPFQGPHPTLLFFFPFSLFSPRFPHREAAPQNSARWSGGAL